MSHVYIFLSLILKRFKMKKDEKKENMASGEKAAVAGV